MPFDLATWKATILSHLRHFRQEMPALGIESLFGFLTTMTLLPVVQAATQNSVPVEALLGVAGGVGGNLLAGELEKWRSHATGKESAKSLADSLLPEVAARADLRAELEALWRQLDVAQLARSGLPPREASFLFEQLKQERSALVQGNYLALVGGQGTVVAQGPGAMALSKGATVIQGGVQGNVTFQASPDPAIPARTNYLRALFHWCNALPLTALGGDESQSLYLQDVYIALDTESSVALSESEKAARSDQQRRNDGGTRRQTALEAVVRHKRLALLGDPGSGKSTFIRELVARVAAAAEGGMQALPNFPPMLIPVVITLREMALFLQTLARESRARPTDKEFLQLFWKEIKGQLNELYAAPFLKPLVVAFRDGMILLVLDGLDELKDTLRPYVNQLVAALLRRYPTLWRVIITCRKRSYLTPVAGFVGEFLAPFTREQSLAFIRRWYEGLHRAGYYTPEEAGRRAENLSIAALAPLLRDLAQNPMLLTTMAIIHQRDTRLPPERVKLYALAVDNLLRRWHLHKEGTIPPEVQELLANDLKLYEVVERLGYEAHRLQSTGMSEGDLNRGDLLDLLSRKAYFGTAAAAEAFLDYIDTRAGLLLGRGGSEQDDHPRLYSFPHRTFQEYLAGCYLVRGRHRDRVARLHTHAGEGDYWQVAVQLGAETLYFNQQETDVLDLAYDLAPPLAPRNAAEYRQHGWAAQMVALVGTGRVEEDSRERDPVYLHRLRERIVVSLQGNVLPAIERVGVGNILAEIGDPRFDPEQWYLPNEPLLGFVEIPAGSFTMGSEQATDERPLHQVTLPRYWMARYPVTVAQWQAYVTATGFSPAEHRSVQGIANHPVRYITWHEAMAYCKWLNEQLIGKAKTRLQQGKMSEEPIPFWHGLQAESHCVVLPSEAEWERAARFTDGRNYPWNEKITPEHANYGYTQTGGTSPVGAFSQGRSAEGIEELSGNVWEWTRSLYAHYPYHADDGRENIQSDGRRVVRGGAFSNSYDYVLRGAVRYAVKPGDGYDANIGFRVCLSPFSR